MFKILIILCFLQAFKQENNKLEPGSEKYKLSGKIMYTSFYQGGAPRPEAYLQEYPLANFTIAVVAYSNADVKPKFVKKITTDEKGVFTIDLPNGTYGFVGVDELDNLNPGQWLPSATQKQNDHNWYSTSWTLQGGGPILIDNNNRSNVHLICNKSTTCMRCP